MIKGHLSPHGCVLLELDTSHGSALRVTAAVMLGAVVDMEVTSMATVYPQQYAIVKNRRIRKKGLYRAFFWKGDRNILAQPTGKHYPKLKHTEEVNY